MKKRMVFQVNNNENRLELLSNAIAILKRSMKKLDVNSDEYKQKLSLINSLAMERDYILKNINID